MRLILHSLSKLHALLFLAFALLGAMEVPSAASVLALFKAGREREAIQMVKSNRHILPSDLAVLPGIQPYLHYFSSIRRFTIADWDSIVTGLQRTSTIQAIQASECAELKHHLMVLESGAMGFTNVVEVNYKLSEMTQLLQTWKMIRDMEAEEDSSDSQEERNWAAQEEERRRRDAEAEAEVEVEERLLEQRRRQQEQHRQEQQRQEQQRQEQQRQEQQRQEQQRQEQQRLEQERRQRQEQQRQLQLQEQQRLEQQRLEQHRQTQLRELQRLLQLEEQQRLLREQRRLEQEREQQRLEQEQEQQRLEQQPAEGQVLFDQELYEAKMEGLRSSPYMAQTQVPCQTAVDRFNLLETAEPALMAMTVEEAKSAQWRVRFTGEDGIDVGGPKREFFTLVAQRLFNPDLALFDCPASGGYALQVHPLSAINNDHWGLFTFAGRFLAMAAIHKQVIGTKFSSAFYKYILGHPFDLDDLKDIDIDVHKNIQYVIDNDPEILCLTFTHSYEQFGELKEAEMKPNGAQIDVTEANKTEYVQCLIDFHARNMVAEQMERVCQGFFQLIPKDIITVLDWPELQYLLSGTSEINVADWKANTVYENCDDNHEVATMFWEVVEQQLNNKQRADLLQFTTGSPYVPITGFKDLQGSHGRVQKFNLTFDRYSASPAIVAHSCFNQICIPRHQSRAQFEEYLQQAILNKEGFGDI